jgi:[NiFe] hydrogenase assembly HybE family chaperone
MTDEALAQERAQQVADVFERIHGEQMAGLPLLNEALSVTALGFRLHEGRTMGMVVTPWMMGLILFPRADDEWDKRKLGDKQSHAFPGGSLRFMVNAIDGLGVCQMHSVHSPMRTFHDQQAALAEAASFLQRLLTPADPDAAPQDPVDEELLGRILRGEAVPELDSQAVNGTAGPKPAVVHFQRDENARPSV